MDTRASNVIEINPKKDKLDRFLGFLELDKQNSSLLFDILTLALELGETEVAAKLVDSYEQIPENTPELNAVFGHIYLYLLRYQDACESLNFALKNGVDTGPVLMDLARCYHYLREPLSSKKILSEHPQLKNDFPQAYCILYARALYACDQSSEAIQELKFLTEQNLRTSEADGLLALLLFEENSEYPLAMELANDALVENEKCLEALLAKSLLLLDAGDYDNALKTIQSAIQHHPTSGRAWSTLAQIEFNNFHFDEARLASEKACGLMADHIGTWHILAWTHLMQDNLEGALDAFNESLKLDKRFFETHGGLAAVYAHMGETKKANNHLKIAEKLEPFGFASTYARMVLHTRDKEFDKAQNLFNRAKGHFDKRLGSTPETVIEKRLGELFKKNGIN